MIDISKGGISMVDNSFNEKELNYMLLKEKEKEAEIVIEFVNMLDRDSRKELLRILQAALLLKILKLNREN